MISNRQDAHRMDSHHPAKPYDPLLRAGFCLLCALPIRIDDRGAWTHAPGAPESPRPAEPQPK